MESYLLLLKQALTHVGRFNSSYVRHGGAEKHQPLQALFHNVCDAASVLSAPKIAWLQWCGYAKQTVSFCVALEAQLDSIAQRERAPAGAMKPQSDERTNHDDWMIDGGCLCRYKPQALSRHVRMPLTRSTHRLPRISFALLGFQNPLTQQYSRDQVNKHELTIEAVLAVW